MLVHLPLGGTFDSQLLPATRMSLAVVARLFEQYLGVGKEGTIDLIEGGIGVKGVISARLENTGLVVKRPGRIALSITTCSKTSTRSRPSSI